MRRIADLDGAPIGRFDRRWVSTLDTGSMDGRIMRASFLLLATSAVAGFVSPSKASLGPSRQPSIGSRRAEKSPQALTSTVLTQTVAPAIGAALANGMFFSGLPEVLNKRRAGALGEFNPLPMPIVMSNTMGWTIYSFLTRDRFVAMANMPGLLLSCWYMMTMMRLATGNPPHSLTIPVPPSLDFHSF